MKNNKRCQQALNGAFTSRRVSPRRFTVATTVLLLGLGSSIAHGTLPAIPKGVSAITSPGSTPAPSTLSNADVDMISIGNDWNTVENPENTLTWTTLDSSISLAAGSGKSVLMRLGSGGGSHSNGGSIPDWVYTAMGVSPTSTTATYGTTYSFVNSSTTYCIPVFWQPTYLAKKKALIAKAGAHFSSQSALKIFAVTVANATSEDWNVPHSTSGSPSQQDRWLHLPTDSVPGAGYSTSLMINAAIHTGTANFSDGNVSGMTLTSTAAVFTQADVGKGVGGTGYKSNTHIVGWNSTTSVTLDKTLNSGSGANFSIVNRDDGLIDVAMAAFPNQYITMAVGANGPNLDAADSTADGDTDPDDHLARKIGSMVQSKYPGRYITQRNSVSTKTPLESSAGTGWVLLAEASGSGYYTAGQALSFVNGDTTYRMNGDDNCDHDNGCHASSCSGTCALSYDDILRISLEHFATYTPSYYEIYPGDLALTNAVSIIHDTLNP